LPRLTIPYTHATPILSLALVGPGGSRGIAGVVDSGADRSLLPKGLAAKLGIPDEDLEPTPEGSGGAGGAWFPTWVIPYSIKAQVIVPFPQPRGLELWGPEMELNPEFATDTIPLFGREDFFETFTVTLDQPGGGLFYLDYSN
jgi:hypothetical protein